MTNLSPERWRQVERVLDAVLDLPSNERAAFVDRACSGDPELRAEVERLLRSCDRAERFLEEPASAFAAPLLSEPAPAEPAEGRRIGPYRILREAGRGGMGTVYLAERADAEFRQRVALKVVRRGMELDDHILRRFVEERRILASLEHPNIARLLDGGVTDDGLPFFAMEYVEGTPINQYCDEHRLSIPARLDLFCSVCQAVQFAHRNLVVHRDIKPSNILVTEAGEPKLLDFGIAKLLAHADTAGSPPITRTRVRLMTPEYASPEQVRGEAISTASDVYSLGILLYELLTGHHPYRSSLRGPHGMERRVLEEEPARPSTVVSRVIVAPDAGERIVPERVSEARGTSPEKLRRRLRGDLDAIVLMALRKEPERRYATAEQLAADVRRHLRGLPVSARLDTWMYRVGKFSRRHRAGVVMAAAFALVLIGFSGVTIAQSRRIAAERDAARQVAGFLTDLFAGADPRMSRGQEITARELLDRGASRVEDELQGQPEVRARIMDAMGLAYLGLGEYDRASHLLEGALALRRRLHRGDHPEIAASLYNLAFLLRDQGRFPESEALYREALAMRHRLFGVEHPEVVEGLNGLAYVLRGRGEFGEAESLYRSAITIGRSVLDAPHPDLAVSLNGLGVVVLERGDYRAAEPLLRDALAMNRSLYGDDHPEINTVLFNLARVLHGQGDLAAAESVYSQAIAVGRKVRGERHPLVAIDLVGLADVLSDRGDLEAAARLYHEALGIQRDGLPSGHVRTGTTLLGLGRVLLARGRAQEAMPLVREALDIRLRTLAPGHWQIAEAQSALGACLSALGHAGEAEPLLVRGYQTLLELRGEQDPATRRALQSLTGHYGRMDKLQKAASLPGRATR